MKKDFFKEPKAKKVYKFKKYQTEHLILIPLMPAVWVAETIIKAVKNSIAWKPQTADKILTKYLYKRAERCEENGKQFLYCWLRPWWTFWEYGAMPWQKTFVKKFNHQISDYLIGDFELEGFTKVVELNEDSESKEYDIYFYKKEVE